MGDKNEVAWSSNTKCREVGGGGGVKMEVGGTVTQIGILTRVIPDV